MGRLLKYSDVSTIIAVHFRFEKWPKTHFFCPKRKISIRFFSKSGQMSETFDQMPIFIQICPGDSMERSKVLLLAQMKPSAYNKDI